MAKYYARRRYGNNFSCSTCGTPCCNPTLFHFVSAGGTWTGCTNCLVAGAGAVCPDCRQPVIPTKVGSAAQTVVRRSITMLVFNAECSKSCPGIAAGGQPTATPGPALQPAAPVAPAPAQPSESEEMRKTKLRERVAAAYAQAAAFGHRFDGLALIAMTDKEWRTACSVCGGKLRVDLGRFGDANGEVLAFPCKKLQQRK